MQMPFSRCKSIELMRPYTSIRALPVAFGSLVSPDKREAFFLDITRSRIKLTKGTYQSTFAPTASNSDVGQWPCAFGQQSGRSVVPDRPATIQAFRGVSPSIKKECDHRSELKQNSIFDRLARRLKTSDAGLRNPRHSIENWRATVLAIASLGPRPRHRHPSTSVQSHGRYLGTIPAPAMHRQAAA